MSPDDQPVWLCHAPPLPLVWRSRLAQNARLIGGLRRALAGGLGPWGPGGVAVPLCLARAARQRDARRRLLPHAVCLTTGHPDSVDAARILDRLSPQSHGTFGATPRFRAAIVALRTGADSVEAPHLATAYSRLFPHWCKGCFGHVCCSRGKGTSVPMTAAVWSRCFSSGGKRSMRAASTACTVAGT